VVELIVHAKRLYCQVCKRSFSERLPGVKPRSKATEAFKQQVFEDHQAGHSQKHLSRTHRVCESTVGRWNKFFLMKRYTETSTARTICPVELGIDEHHFTKKLGFATTFTDHRKHRVFDVILGRSEESLKGYLLKLKGRERVRLVTMDLSQTYRNIVHRYFPNARIVADRFHVVRVVMQAFHKVWSTLDKDLRYNRGLLSLVRRNPKNLKPEQKVKFEVYLKANPVLDLLYSKREELLAKMRLKSVGEYGYRKHIQEFLKLIEELKNSGWEEMQTLGETLESWSEEIVRMWRFKRNNGMTEGFHNKMELIARRAYGFRNFENYRTRVLALCGWNGLFAERNFSSTDRVPRLMM
jgi:transposase